MSYYRFYLLPQYFSDPHEDSAQPPPHSKCALWMFAFSKIWEPTPGNPRCLALVAADVPKMMGILLTREARDVDSRIREWFHFAENWKHSLIQKCFQLPRELNRLEKEKCVYT